MVPSLRLGASFAGYARNDTLTNPDDWARYTASAFMDTWDGAWSNQFGAYIAVPLRSGIF